MSDLGRGFRKALPNNENKKVKLIWANTEKFLMSKTHFTITEQTFPHSTQMLLILGDETLMSPNAGCVFKEDSVFF